MKEFLPTPTENPNLKPLSTRGGECLGLGLRTLIRSVLWKGLVLVPMNSFGMFYNVSMSTDKKCRHRQYLVWCTLRPVDWPVFLIKARCSGPYLYLCGWYVQRDQRPFYVTEYGETFIGTNGLRSKYFGLEPSGWFVQN